MQNNTFSGLFVGQKIIKLKRIDSTNNFLKNELAKSTPLVEGTVILAEEQFAGRGQQLNSWVSEPGKNLTFSLLLTPGFLAPDQQFFLNKVISIAINEALQEVTGTAFHIKWPNDIYLGRQKVGGVLIENLISGKRWKHAIVGIGINVNQEEFPAELPNATSLIKILHSYYALNTLLSQLCSSIESWYLRLRAEQYEEISKRYLAGLYQLEEVRKYRVAGGDPIEARITGVSDDGKLVVDAAGNTVLYNLKEIEFLNE